VRRAQFEVVYWVRVEVPLLLSPAKQALNCPAVVVDSPRCCLLVGWPPALRPAVLLGGDIIEELADVVSGDPFRWWPVISAGILLEVT